MKNPWELLGRTTNYALSYINSEFSNVDFFKKYGSKEHGLVEDFLIRSAIDFGSLVIQPIFIVGCIIIALISSIVALMSALSLCGFKLDDKDEKELAPIIIGSLVTTGAILIALVLSPIGNLISFIGSTVMTVESLIANDNIEESATIATP